MSKPLALVISLEETLARALQIELQARGLKPALVDSSPVDASSRPIEPHSASENPEGWAAVADWEYEQRASLERQLAALGAAGAWSSSPPDSEGFWWLYGDDEFGSMGGNYTGAVPADIDLHVVKVQRIGSGLIGVSKGRMIRLTPFDAAQKKPGYLGVWQRMVLPKLPSQSS